MHDATYGTVETTEQLTPNTIRIVFGGAGLANFAATDATDQYVNALFFADDAEVAVPFDVEAQREAPQHERPRGRRYTVRHWDPDQRRLTIDFVTHGSAGFGGRWAQQASAGDRLQMLGPSGGYAPDPDAPWFLMIGDESALPAIAASLTRVPAGRRAVVIGIVDDADHEVPLDDSPNVEITWLYRDGRGDSSQHLVELLAAIEWRDQPDVFVHGEAAEVRAVRKFLIAERGVDGDSASISPYWRRGQNDEDWRKVKRQWLADQATDV